MKLWHIECIVTDARHYDLMVFLEKIKAYNVVSKTFVNGQDKEEQPKARTNDQVKWLVAHIKGDTFAVDLKKGWIAAGFRPQSLYGALGRAVTQKLIKKVSSGKYRSVGA